MKCHMSSDQDSGRVIIGAVSTYKNGDFGDGLLLF